MLKSQVICTLYMHVFICGLKTSMHIPPFHTDLESDCSGHILFTSIYDRKHKHRPQISVKKLVYKHHVLKEVDAVKVHLWVFCYKPQYEFLNMTKALHNSRAIKAS